MGRFARFFRKRAIARELDAIVSTIEAHQAEENALLAAIEEIQHRQSPDTQGLSIGQKRSINFMILSFVQHIYLHFEGSNLATLAKEAGDKSVGAIKYGNKRECDALLKRFADRAGSFDGASGFADELRKRARLLREKAKFKDADDPVPISESVSTIYRIVDDRVAEELQGNLLGRNFWSINDAVSR